MKRRDFAIGLGGSVLASALGTSAGSQSPPASGPIAAEQAWARRNAVPDLGRSDAFLILQNGQLVFERYDSDQGPDTRHVSWSMAKSVTQALTGVAVRAGKVDIDRPLATVAHPDPKLNLRSLLTLTDGLQWDENGYSPVTSDASKMLYGPGRLDTAAYVAAKPQETAPGTHWRYSTGSFQLAAAELQARLFPDAKTPPARRAAMADWIGKVLFQPVGMTSALAEFDPAGSFYGGSLVYASARDFARFGELYRLDGVVSGQRILPEGWVKFASMPTVEPAYGAGFWLEAKPGNKPFSLMLGYGPMDGVSAQGHQGQVILVVPSKSLTLVRLGLGDDSDANWKALGGWITEVVRAFPNTSKT